MTAIPEEWDELCLIEVQPQAGTGINFAALTEDITAMDWGEKQMEGRKMVSGGNVVKRSQMTDESITLRMVPIGVGSDGETTATGVMQLFHTQSSPDSTQPLVVVNTHNRTKYRLVLLWATTLPASAVTLPASGIYAYRIQIFNAYLVSVKPSYDDKALTVEATFKWTPFQKDGTSNKTEESTDDTAQLASVTSFT